VVVLIATVVPATTAPAPGLNVGVAAVGTIEYVADATAESAKPDAVARALMVVAAVIGMGAVYVADDAVGVLPSVV
jgi:hypothetical protein